MNSKEYAKLYRERNKERIAAQIKEWKDKNILRIKQNSKQYYDDNRDVILDKKKEYHQRPHVQKRAKTRNAKLYQDNKEAILLRQAKRRKERMDFVALVVTSYGCQNPNCGWRGELKSYQLDFHHFDPSTKTTEVAKMESWSFKKIVEEINKCVVLCKNCHADVHHGSVVLNEQMICKVSHKD